MYKSKEYEKIKAKALLGLPLTNQERAIFLLFLATLEQAKEYLQKDGKK